MDILIIMGLGRQLIYVSRIQIHVNKHKLWVATTYQEFPFPETLNKRVKKLVQIMVKIEDNYDFDNLAQSDDEEIKCWSVADKQVLFNLLCDYGVPIGVDGRQNWQELKDKLI